MDRQELKARLQQAKTQYKNADKDNMKDALNKLLKITAQYNKAVYQQQQQQQQQQTDEEKQRIRLDKQRLARQIEERRRAKQEKDANRKSSVSTRKISKSPEKSASVAKNIYSVLSNVRSNNLDKARQEKMRAKNNYDNDPTDQNKKIWQQAQKKYQSIYNIDPIKQAVSKNTQRIVRQANLPLFKNVPYGQ